MRSYRSLAIAGGERIAALESVEGEPKTGPRIVVRDTATGKILSTLRTIGLHRLPHRRAGWSPDQQGDGLISTDSQGRHRHRQRAARRQTDAGGRRQGRGEQRALVARRPPASPCWPPSARRS
jgi:hypothetical protein